MWCGPNAVAYVIDWDRDQVWLHIRSLREQAGRRMTDRPIGGTHVSECLDAIARAGYQATPVWDGSRRVRYGDFVRGEGRRGSWLLLQSRHFFSRRAGDPVRNPRAVILQAWRITRAAGPRCPVPAPGRPVAVDQAAAGIVG